MINAKKIIAILVLLVFSLYGCATSGSIGIINASSFKLTTVSVQWVDNPKMPFKIHTVAFGQGVTPPVPSAGYTSAGRLYMHLFSETLGLDANEQLYARLATRGVRKGEGQTIILTPVDGLLSGSEATLIVRIDVVDNISRQRWSGHVQVANTSFSTPIVQTAPSKELSKDLANAVLQSFDTAFMLK